MGEKVIRSGGKKVVKTVLLLLVLVVLILVTAFLFIYTLQKNSERQIAEMGNVSSVLSAPVAVGKPTTSYPESAPEDEPADAQLSDWQLVLVNINHKMPNNFDSHIVEEFDAQLDERLVEPYKQMYAAAKKEGIFLWISSSYRSPDKQEELFQREIEQNMKAGMSEKEAEEKASTAVQRPGYSEHNTGLALDFNGVTEDFEHDSAYLWLMKHAQEYGFILRYPRDKEDITKIMFEPWHFRYVGPENAEKINELGMCLEEYVDYLKQNGVS